MSFAAYHRQCVAHYLTTNKLTSLGAINGNILEDITQRAYESYEAQIKAKKKRGDATPEEIAIYEAYPRRIAKVDACVAIRDACQRTSPEALLEATRRYALCVARWPTGFRFHDGRDLVPYPATWFRAGRYADDPKEWLPAGMFERPDDPQSSTAARKVGHECPEPYGWKEEYPDCIYSTWEAVPSDSKRAICDHMNKVRA